MKIFAEILLEAIEQFYVRKNYHLFDPHVGDNFCQARACQILLLSKQDAFSYEQINSIKAFISHLDNLVEIWRGNLKTSRYVAGLDGSIKTRDFLSKENLKLELSSSLKFIFYSYFLTKFRRFSKEGSYIDYLALQRFFHRSNSFCKNIVKKYQRVLAHESCEFVMGIFEKNPFLIEKLSGIPRKRKIDSNGREVLPTLFGSEVIFHFCLHTRIKQYFLIKTKPSGKVYACVEEGGLLKRVFQDLFSLANPSIVWYGTSHAKLPFDAQIAFINKMSLQQFVWDIFSKHPCYPRLSQNFEYSTSEKKSIRF